MAKSLNYMDFSTFNFNKASDNINSTIGKYIQDLSKKLNI